MEVAALVTPGSRKERVVKVGEATFEIAVREVAERNEANKRVRALIAEVFRVPLAKVRMVRGARAKKKVFNVSV